MARACFASFPATHRVTEAYPAFAQQQIRSRAVIYHIMFVSAGAENRGCKRRYLRSEHNAVGGCQWRTNTWVEIKIVQGKEQKYFVTEKKNNGKA